MLNINSLVNIIWVSKVPFSKELRLNDVLYIDRP